jgi:hypothetical protein
MVNALLQQKTAGMTSGLTVKAKMLYYTQLFCAGDESLGPYVAASYL